MNENTGWEEEFRILNDRYQTLASFQEAAAWVEAAEKLQQKCEEIHRKMTQDADTASEKLTQVVNERKNKPFWQRNFGSRKDEKELTARLHDLNIMISWLDKNIGNLRHQIKGVPKNQNEQMEMLNTINIKKEELELQKHEVKENIEHVNLSTTQSRGGWMSARDGGMIGSPAKIAMATDTPTEELAIMPLEDKKADLEARAAELERDEIRIRRISGGVDSSEDVKSSGTG